MRLLDLGTSEFGSRPIPSRQVLSGDQTFSPLRDEARLDGDPVPRNGDLVDPTRR